MKHNRIFLNTVLAMALSGVLAACQEDIVIGTSDIPELPDPEQTLLYVTDGEGSTGHSDMEFRDNSSIEFYVNATKPSAGSDNVTLVYDLSVLDEYNKANNTNFEAIPQGWVSFSNGGTVSLASGESKSAAITMSVTSDGSLDHEATYCIPLRFTSANTASRLADASQSRLVFVKDLTALADCHKTWTDENGVVHEGVKIFSCMEVNDTNPLNNLCFTLKESGKYFVDAVILFSGNINYDELTGRVYFFANPNVQHLLNNREKYLKPLQDRGIKVIMGILGNHDRAGVANLSDETALLFAKEVKALCDTYSLDGVFYDDEYSSYESGTITPGFVSPSREAASRLIYEVWKLQPQRWNIAYVYSRTSRLVEIDGVQPGVYCQYALHDYGGSYDLSSNYPGMPRSNMGLYSQEFNLGRFARVGALEQMKKDGYGSHMIFAMDPTRKSNWSEQLSSMRNCSSAFYGEDLVFDGNAYEKDW